MKHVKRIFAFALTLIMAFAIAVPTALAATITINRDGTWDENAESKNVTYTYYKIFDADITTAATVDVATGALAQGSNGNVVYTISGTNAADKVAALPDIFNAKHAADGKYYITLTREGTSAADIVSALKDMVSNPDNTGLFPGTSETTGSNPAVLDVPSDGYYLILASNGKNAAVQTIGDVTINEKNDYPTIDKKQKKQADTEYTEAEIPAEIGTYVDFQVTVDIPADANKSIAVIDKMTDGLQYDDQKGLTLNPNVEYSTLVNGDNGYDSGADWQIKFSDQTVIANRGKKIVITYRALVTAGCLADTGRENEVTLNYDDNNYILKDETNYTTYFGGIEKVDGQNHETKLQNVKFELTVNGQAFNVTKVNDATNGDYYIPGGDSNEVVTGENGLIVIRGLDNTKTYTLTETETNAGYNLLDGPTNLTLQEDNNENAYNNTAVYGQIENNKGAQMPSTGGIGTTIFYVVGGVMVAGAVIFLLTKRRVNAE